jgi:hypothetical protein
VVVLALSLIAPAFVGVDKAIQLSRRRKTTASESKELITGPAVQASA